MLISLSGMARSGKSTVAKHLVENMGFTEISFAKSLKKHIGAGVFDLSYEQLYGELKEVVDARYGIAPRMILQLGGEYMRKIYKGIWVERALSEIEEGKDYVISDARYRNELEAIKEKGGWTWLIGRPGAGAAGGVEGHISETDFLRWEYGLNLPNEGSIKELLDSVTTAATLGRTILNKQIPLYP